MEAWISNYDITKRKMQGEFLKYDQEKMIEKFDLEFDDEFIYLKFVHTIYRISRHSGFVEHDINNHNIWNESDYNEVMTIYDILCYSKDDCHVSGEFVQMQNLSRVMTSTTYAGNGMFEKDAKLFDHKDLQLAQLCEQMGGIPEERGDVSYRIPVFGELDVIFRFWNSDDEFPPELQFLCDKNMLQYMHYETVWYLISHIIRLLRSGIEE